MAEYWQQSKRPLTSLAFILPLLVLYETGVLLLGPSAVRNGADAWLRQFLDVVGLTGYFLLPFMTVGALLCWHYTTRSRWRLSTRILYGMFVESASLAFLLMIVAYVQATLLDKLTLLAPAGATVSLSATDFSMLGRMIGFFGAGIYEEVLFRLLLVPILSGIIGLVGGTPMMRVGGAIVLSSLAFSVAHYVGPHGEVFSWFTFLFRFLAGDFFAVLFVYRGFGIAAGSHALYDVFVGML